MNGDKSAQVHDNMLSCETFAMAEDRHSAPQRLNYPQTACPVDLSQHSATWRESHQQVGGGGSVQLPDQPPL